MQSTGEGYGLYGPCISKLHAEVSSLELLSGPRYDVERFGIIEAFGSLRQCDLIASYRERSQERWPLD